MNLSYPAALVAAVFGSHQAQALPSYAIGNVSGNVTLANKLLSVVWSEENCESMKNGLHPDSLERVACPAVRFLARDGKAFARYNNVIQQPLTEKIFLSVKFLVQVS